MIGRRALLSREVALSAMLAALFAGFAAATPGFLDWFSLLERVRYWAIPGLMAVPMTFIIATSGIDLSVASVVAMTGIVFGLLYRDAHFPVAAAAGAAVLAGGAAGAFNGGVSSYLRIPPLVVTLATMALFRGVAMGLSKAQPIGDFPDAFLWLSQGNAFSVTLSGESVGIPAPLFALAAAVALGWIVLRCTWVGRFAECIGESPVAAEFAAIDVRRLKLALYTVSGLVAGVAGLLNAALYATAKADTANGVELEVIACVVVGGTRISGGHGSVVGSLLGLLIIGVLRYGLELTGVKSQYIVIVVGVLLIVTAALNEWMARRRGARE